MYQTQGVSKSMAKAEDTRTKEQIMMDELQRQFPGLDINKIKEMLDHFAPHGLTSKEEARLSELEKEHAQKVKNAKLDAFKTLPRTVRDAIVNEIFKKRSISKIRQIEVPVDNELEALRMKNHQLGVRHDEGFGYGSNDAIPGLTDDEILDASAEAELLNTDTNDG